MNPEDDNNMEIPTATDVDDVNEEQGNEVLDDEDDPLADDPNTDVNEESSLNGEVRQKDDSRSIFQARVFAEQNSNVYGAEIILFGSETEEPIERILITDVTDYDRLNVLVNNLQKALVPYTKSDLDNLGIIADYLSDKNNADKRDAYNNITWSSLHNKGDLETILDNNSGLDSKTREDYLKLNDKVVINATHLNGYTETDFSSLDHTHHEFLSNNHLNLVGDSKNRGHVSIVDNLNTTTVGGTALSAKQGNVLKNEIKKLHDDIYNNWKVVKKGNYVTLRVNEFLRLAVCDYYRMDYTGLKDSTGKHDLHAKGVAIPFKYAPSRRVVTPVYNGTVVLGVDTDGAMYLYNTVKHSSWNIRIQCLWYYG